MKTFYKSVLFYKSGLFVVMALVESSAATRQMLALPLAAQDLPNASSFASPFETSPVMAPDGNEAQDRAREARARQQEALDRGRTRAARVGNREQESSDRTQGIYDRGTQALDDGNWQKAVQFFDEVIGGQGSAADGAFYWKAYAQSKLGQRGEALSTLADLKQSFPQSRWVGEAKQLELEVRQGSGQKVSPESQSDEDLKLMAINGLLRSDPERAVPLLEKILHGNQPPKVKERALFVLSQSGSPRAREILTKIARGEANPDLQVRALNDLGLFGGKESRQMLADIYSSSTDERIKRSILRSFMVGGQRDRLLAVAKTETSAALRREAIQQLGVMGAQTELWQLYQAEPTLEVKEKILQSMFKGGNSDKLLEVARNDNNPRLRRAAIQSLGLMGAGNSGGALATLYAHEKDREVRGAVLNAFFIQGNARTLIEIARQEKDPGLKRAAVQKISLMRSKEATDFMMEILSK